MSAADTSIEIDGRRIGAGQPVYVVAELSANHHKSFDEAVRLVEAAKQAGADAVKLQTYTADTITIESERPEFRVSGGTLWDGRSLHDLYAEASTPWEWQPRLKEVAEKIGLQLFSSPFDATAVDFLEQMKVSAYKVASFELVDLPLIEKIARTGKPIILSTGMGTFEEIEEALRAAREAGAAQLALLHCTSAYPADAEEMNLKTIPHLAEALGVPVGLSDHTLGISVPVAAVALGACIVEKHFTLSRDVPGPDSGFSLEPAEFRAMAEAVRDAQRALGEARYEASAREQASRALRRSLYVVADVQAGELFTAENIRSIRPALGLEPKHLPSVLGKRASRDVRRGEPVSWELLS